MIDTISKSTDHPAEHQHRERVCGSLQDATCSRYQSSCPECLLPTEPISQQGSQNAPNKVAERETADEDAFDAWGRQLGKGFQEMAADQDASNDSLSQLALHYTNCRNARITHTCS
jgi:hypothetical protein